MRFYEDFLDLVELVSVNSEGAIFKVYYQNEHQEIFVPKNRIEGFDRVKIGDETISYIMRIYKKWTFLSPKVWAVLPAKITQEQFEKMASDIERQGLWDF